MKKLALGIALLLMVFAVGCGNKTEAPKVEDKPAETVEKPAENAEKPAEEAEKPAETGEKKDLIVFAAASMTESLEEIKKIYEEKNPDINLVYTFDSSGTLKTQIEEGADCDVFISAAVKQMDALGEKVDASTRMDLLENKVVLAVPKGNPKEVKSFDDINTDKVKAIALGNSDVPVGQYSEGILKKMNVWDAIQPKVTFGSNVKEVTTWVSEAVVDCGIIYKTDAFSAGLEVVDEATPEMLEKPVVYPAAVLAKSEKTEDGKKYLEFLKSEEGKKVLESVGFSVID